MKIRQNIGKKCGHHLREFLGTSKSDKLVQSKMPEGFSFATMKTKYPRYDAVGIKIDLILSRIKHSSIEISIALACKM